MILAALALLGAAGRAEAEQVDFPSVTVIGSATLSARPDTAEVMAGVVTQAATAVQALAQNNTAMERVLKALAALGIADKDVQTSGLSVMPQRASHEGGRAQPPRIIGYEVTNQARVKIRDLAGLGRLLDTLVAEGANVLGGIAFSIGDPSALLQQARTNAIADARQKAQTYTAAAGVVLGRVVYIRDGSAGIPRPVGVRLMAESRTAAVPVAPGEQELEVSVSVTYAIE